MRKYIVWFSGILLICVAIYRLTSAFTPKVGPVGNGPNEQLIWAEFFILMIGSIMFLVLGIIIYVLEKKEKANSTIQLVFSIGIFGIVILFSGLVVIGTPYIFIRIVNLIVIIALSGFIGAFIRALIFRWNKDIK